MICLIQNQQDYNNDLRAMIMAFFPGVKIAEGSRENMELKIAGLGNKTEDAEFVFEACYEDRCTRLKLYYLPDKSFHKKIDYDYRDREGFRNKLKLAAYHLLSEYTGRRLPWGDLTGVRPTKIAMRQLLDGKDDDAAVKHYMDLYDVSQHKAELAVKVAKRELMLTKDFDLEREFCLYVGIPFCPSRCLYCSFPSYPIEAYRDKALVYIEKLKEEISTVKMMLGDGRRLVSIYIGGGTPTSISHTLMDNLLLHIENTFDLSHLREYTVEAGRPDSISEEKLAVLKKHGVTRMSINPQTMNDETLKTIGRAHTSAQTEEAFFLARGCGFDNINMDIIAGLPDESLGHMEYTLAKLKKLAPESITVHSLAIKRAARLNEQMTEFGGSIHHDTDRMLDAVREAACELGMEPYYLYRQKNIGGNLENVGYAKEGCECLYNILIMEELTDIISVGAGASTKLTFHKENRVERVENCKSVDDYIERLAEMLDRKKKHNYEKFSEDI
ncbi:MAG: coproporphyrinogen dehydrogenase HemZ [Clostridium sp.]|nr:coproporphyrinogen dehydrogenase HemZ [Clostridium sp.]MCM1209509.1 coproporphyrinogen dehydrogenase HemZ [Ruminococcus sp.]